MTVRYHEVGVGISLYAVLFGIRGAILNLKDTISSFKDLKHDKDCLKKVKEKGRTI